MNNKLLSKLRQPVHISYIAEHVFKKPIEETQKLLNQLIIDNVVEESKKGDDFYVLKKEK